MAADISEDDGYGRAIAGGYVWAPNSCRYSLMNADTRQKCFSAKNITRFFDYGDRCAFVPAYSVFVSVVSMRHRILWVESSQEVFCVNTTSS